MPNSAPAPTPDLDLEVIGELTDEHLDVLAQLLVDLDSETKKPRDVRPSAA